MDIAVVVVHGSSVEAGNSLASWIVAKLSHD